MPAYVINQGENVLLQFNLISMGTGLTWQGAWSASTTYVVDDVVVEGGVVYKSLSGSNLNHQPPNGLFWEVLPPILASDVKFVDVRLLQADEVAVEWKYRAGASTPPQPNVALSDGLFQCELLRQDSLRLAGLYDIRFELGVRDSIYVGSGIQTDVTVTQGALSVLLPDDVPPSS